MDSNSDIKYIYNISSLSNEFWNLEDQFDKSNTKFDILPYYQSLLSRIEHSKYSKENGQSFEAFNTLQSAIYSKIEIEKTLKLLREGEEKINLGKHKNAVLVLGNTGAGKSTITLLLTGAELISVKGSGRSYLIKDFNNKISVNSTVKSQTTFPELMIDTYTDTAFYDCPGFSDTRSTSNDIATTYFIKTVTDYLQSVKLIIVINYASLEKGVDRLGFERLATHITDIINDIEKFKDSIVLIANKVNNTYECDDDGRCVLVPDDEIINGIVEYLEEAKQTWRKELTGYLHLTFKRKVFLKQVVRFINLLLAKDGDEYIRLGIFRRPNKLGPLRKMTLLQNERNRLENILHTKLVFTDKHNNDFGYTVSEKSKNEINNLAARINANINYCVRDVTIAIQKYYLNLVETMNNTITTFVTPISVEEKQSDAEIYLTKLNDGIQVISDLVINIQNVTINELTENINRSMMGNIGIDIPNSISTDISNYEKYLTFLLSVRDDDINLQTSDWSLPFLNIIQFISGLNYQLQINVSHMSLQIKNKIELVANSIAGEITKHYHELKISDIKSLLLELEMGISHISTLKLKVSELVAPEILIQEMDANMEKLKISVPVSHISIIFNQGKYLQFLKQLKIEDVTINNSFIRIKLFDKVIEDLQELKNWYTFLVNVNDRLSEYDIQKNTSKFDVDDVGEFGIGSQSDRGIYITKSNLKLFLEKIGIVSDFGVPNTQGDELKIKELNDILRLTLKHKTNVSCESNRLLIKGDFIKLSDVNGYNCSGGIKSIQIFARNKIFIDEDLNKEGAMLKLAIISPKWEILGRRKISLDGVPGVPHSASKGRNGIYPGNNGADGKPGLPGGSAGSFLGIAEDFVNGDSLTITANGGEGGPGQNGGDGVPGEDGKDAESPSYFCGITGKYEEIGVTSYNPPYNTLFLRNLYYYNYIIYGDAGSAGGKGGDGGAGGYGGNSGNIIIHQLKNKSEISTQTKPGKAGQSGKGGLGKAGGKDGKDKIAECKNNFALGKLEIADNNRTALNGINGYDGGNYKGTEQPLPAAIIEEPAFIINSCKSYSRKNINGLFNKYSSIQFLNNIESNNNIKSLYNTLALVNELEELEKQFYELNEEFEWLPCYESFLHRVSEFASRPKNGEESSEYKKVLCYLYTTVLSRIHTLEFRSDPNLILGVGKYLDLIINNVGVLDSNYESSIINEYRNMYSNSAERKISEANHFVKDLITPEIENITTQIDNKIDILIRETIELQQQARVEMRESIKRKQKLQETLFLRSIFSAVKIVGQVSNFLGPIGTAAGSAIGAITSITESLVLDSQTSQQKTLQLPASVTADLRLLENQVKTVKDQKITQFNELLEEISQEIKKCPEILNNTAVRITDIKKELKLISIADFVNVDRVRELEYELKQELKRKEGELKTEKVNTEEKTASAMTVLGKVNQVLQVGTVGLDIYSKYKNDKMKLDIVSDAVKLSEENSKISNFMKKTYIIQ